MFNPLPLLFVLAPVVLSTALPSSDLTLLPSSAAVSLNPRAIAVIFRRQGCATGKVACGTGCIPNLASNTCCGTYYCDSGRGCDTDGACTCLSTEKKCGTGCIPTAASCCPLDLRYCDAGKYCSPVKGYCCNNVSWRIFLGLHEHTDNQTGRRPICLCSPSRLYASSHRSDGHINSHCEDIFNSQCCEWLHIHCDNHIRSKTKRNL